jgi:GntR family transcriptional repressor for pyruvate dehydrogenase complex
MARGTLAERAADQLRRRIMLGDIRPGTRLEPMRTLAEELGVSLPVVREAVAQLRALGIVQVRHGVGITVSRRTRVAPVLRASRRRATRRELAELRRALEPVLAAAAAHRLTEHRGRELYLALDERARAAFSGDPVVFAAADLDLHTAVARASGNVLAAGAQQMAALSMLADLVACAGSMVADDHLEALHRRLVEAIDAGQPRRAARAAAEIVRRETARVEPRASP